MVTTTVDGAFFIEPLPSQFSSDGEMTALSGSDAYVYTFTTFITSSTLAIVGSGNLNETNVLAQIIGADGRPVGGPIAVQTANEYGDSSYDVAALDNGNFVIVGLQDKDNGRVRVGQIFSATGERIGDSFSIGDGTTDFRKHVSVLADPGGGFTVTYRDPGNTNQSTHSIQSFDAAGEALAPERQLVGPFTDADRPILVRVEGDFEIFGDARHYELVEQSDGTYAITGPAIQENGGNLNELGVGRQPAVALEGGFYAMAGPLFNVNYYPVMRVFKVERTGERTVAIPVTDPENVGSNDFLLSDARWNFPGTGGALLVARPGGGVVAIWTENTAEIRDTANPNYRTGYNIMSQVFDENFLRVGNAVMLHENTAAVDRFLDTATLTDDGRILVTYKQNVPVDLEDVDATYGLFANFFEIGSQGLVQVDEAPGTGTGSTPTPGNDTLTGTSGDDQIAGLGGNDVINGQGGDDSLYGGDGNDFLLGDVRGSPGNDLLEGGAGSDTLNGGAGNNLLYGGSGNDELQDEGGIAIFDGGEGVDTLTLDSRGLTDIVYTLVVDLASGTQGSVELPSDDDTLISIENYTYTGAFNTRISGNEVTNRLVSGNGKDTLSGQDGADFLSSGGKSDRLFGGLGKDTMVGGSGNDTQTGGGGLDRFVFSSGDDRDRITDFDAVGSNHDVLDLRAWSAIGSFRDLKQNHLQQVGDSVIIRAGADQITLVGVSLRQLDAVDFLI